MKQDLRIVFVGGRDRGYETLKMLHSKKFTPLHIFCMPEDEHEKIKFHPKIAQFAKNNKLPITLTKSLRNQEAYSIINNIKPNLIIVMGWRTIIPKNILSIPKYGVIGAHESLLPKYRGFAPINWAVINGEKLTGVTLFYFEEGMDSGDIIAQHKILIGKLDTANDIYQKTKKASLQLLDYYLIDLEKGVVKRKKQNQIAATYTVARVPADGLINWNWSSDKIYNLIRGLSFPYPGAFTYYNNQKIVIQKALILKDPPVYIGRIPGRIAYIGDGFVNVITGDSVLSILEIETNDGKIVKANTILNSIKGTLKNS